MSELMIAEMREIVDPICFSAFYARGEVYKKIFGDGVMAMWYVDNECIGRIDINKCVDAGPFKWYIPTMQVTDDYDFRLTEILKKFASFENELGYWFESDDQIRVILNTFTQFIANTFLMT